MSPHPLSLPRRRGGITCAPYPGMDLDRRKHDVDVIERVLGGIGDTDTSDDMRTRVVDVDVPWASGSSHRILELTVGIGDDEPDAQRRR